MKPIWITLVILFMGIGGPGLGQGAGFPERPINLLVGLAAGGGNDVIARAQAEALKAFLPQPVTIVNKTGGGASIATADVVHAKPDGYTLLAAYEPALTILPHINPNVPYKGPNDFQMISGGAIAPLLVGSRTNVPWKTFPEMLAYARKNPGKVRLGHSGIGSLGYICAETLVQAADVDITLVPFTGAGQGITSLLGGHIDLININPTGLLTGHLRTGTARILAAYAETRNPLLPDVPSLKELGLNVGTHNTNCFVAGPKGMPKDVLQVLVTAFMKAQKSEGFQKFARENMLIVDTSTPEELARSVEKQWAAYRELLKKIKVQ